MITVNDHIALAESEVSYQFYPSAGPGGQNVNKVATAAVLRFDVESSPSLPDDVRARLRPIVGRRMSRDGVITIKAQRFRSQDRNREDALGRLVALIRRAAERPATRPGNQTVAGGGRAAAQRQDAARRHQAPARPRRPGRGLASGPRCV